MIIIWFASAANAGPLIGTVLLNMAVFGAMLSYIMQALTFILLRRNQPNIERPYRTPLGIPGAVVTIVIARNPVLPDGGPELLQGRHLGDPLVRGRHRLLRAIGRNKLILSPEEEFALAHKTKG